MLNQNKILLKNNNNNYNINENNNNLWNGKNEYDSIFMHGNQFLETICGTKYRATDQKLQTSIWKLLLVINAALQNTKFQNN